MASAKLFNPPPGAAAKVSVIDSTGNIGQIPMTYLMTPKMPGFDTIHNTVSWSFYVESPNGKKALFDLGIPPDWEEFAEPLANDLKNRGWNITAEKHVYDILKDHNVDPDPINSIIWSHWHWDHLGSPKVHPGSTDLVVGPGFKKAFGAGWPHVPDAPVRACDWEGRKLVEIDFDGPDTIKIGSFRAVDFHGDGSFYLIDTPGHAIGHLAGLARTTTNPDTFIMMGGDLCHHGGEVRPSRLMGIPKNLDIYYEGITLPRGACPGALCQQLYDKREKAKTGAFFDPNMGLDIPLAIETIHKTQEADAQDNVFFIYAHDKFIKGVVDLFPKSANDWQAKGWRDRALWAFTVDFQKSIQQQ